MSHVNTMTAAKQIRSTEMQLEFKKQNKKQFKRFRLPCCSGKESVENTTADRVLLSLA